MDFDIFFRALKRLWHPCLVWSVGSAKQPQYLHTGSSHWAYLTFTGHTISTEHTVPVLDSNTVSLCNERRDTTRVV
jgi:hypothetical protein